MDNQSDDEGKRERINSLTSRQIEMLRLVDMALTSKEIARHMGLSPHTVDSHLTTAMQKLGVGSRREAVREVKSVGLFQAAGAVDDVAQRPTTRSISDDGENSLDKQSGWKRGWDSVHRRRLGRLETGSKETQKSTKGMGSALVRFLVDGFYITLFFGFMSAVAYGAHLVVLQCEAWHIDPIVLFILKGVSYVLAAIDGLGVISATGVLTYRFVRAVWSVGDD